MSKFVLFECACKAEEQQCGYYNLVSWKIENVSVWKLILRQPHLPGITKDELTH